MAEITLSDYVGYIFSEIVRARDIADQESKRIAELYAKDEVLQHFSVPRFKIPELDLTIPVLVSGARFNSTASLIMSGDDFSAFCNNKLNNVVRTIFMKNRPIVFDGHFPPINLGDVIGRPIPRRNKRGVNSAATIEELYKLLSENADPQKPEIIIQEKWYEIFYQKLEETKQTESYKKHFPNNDLYTQSLNEVTDKVKASTVISETRIKNLLVNPETNLVKTGSSESSVFVVKAKITEEGLFIRTVKDAQTGEEKKVTEFE